MKKNYSKILAIILFVLFGIPSLTLLAQDKKDEFESKVEQIKGKVEKVTVKVDGKDVVFEGEDAEKLAKGINVFSKSPHIMFLSGDEDWCDVDGGHVSMFKFDDDDFNWKDKGDVKKKVEVRIEDGKKKVTVTTNENGEEKTKIYEGDEAEKLLKENKKEGAFNIYLSGDDEKGLHDKFVYFHESDDDDRGTCCCSHHNMKMKMPKHMKGMKKITIEKEIDDLKEEEPEKK